MLLQTHCTGRRRLSKSPVMRMTFGERPFVSCTYFKILSFTNPASPCARLEDGVYELLEFLTVQKEGAGEKNLYNVDATARPDKILELVEKAIKAGASCLRRGLDNMVVRPGIQDPP